MAGGVSAEGFALLRRGCFLPIPSSLNCIYKLRTLPKGGVRFLCALPMQQNKRQNDKIQKTSEKLTKN